MFENFVGPVVLSVLGFLAYTISVYLVGRKRGQALGRGHTRCYGTIPLRKPFRVVDRMSGKPYIFMISHGKKSFTLETVDLIVNMAGLDLPKADLVVPGDEIWYYLSKDPNGDFVAHLWGGVQLEKDGLPEVFSASA